MSMELLTEIKKTRENITVSVEKSDIVVSGCGLNHPEIVNKILATTHFDFFGGSVGSKSKPCILRFRLRSKFFRDVSELPDYVLDILFTKES